MEIQKTLAEITSYEKLCEISKSSTPKLSFWGSQYIIVDGYERTLGIDDITKRLFELVGKNYEFDEEERALGKTIASRIDFIYNDIDSQIRFSNLFTKILAILRSLCFHETPRSYWKLHYGNYTFETYTQSQFNNVFGCTPKDAQTKGFELGELDDGCAPRRWFVNKTP